MLYGCGPAPHICAGGARLSTLWQRIGRRDLSPAVGCHAPRAKLVSLVKREPGASVDLVVLVVSAMAAGRTWTPSPNHPCRYLLRHHYPRHISWRQHFWRLPQLGEGACESRESGEDHP